MATPRRPPVSRLALAAYLAFAAFGAYWGVWGASVPAIQTRSGVSDGALGLALLFVGAGALPAMLLTGRGLDRWGLRLSGAPIAALGLAGAAMAACASDLLTLAVGLGVVGVTSGAADVAMNAVAGRAETEAGRPVITRAHGVFSTAVVLGSLAAGAASGGGLPVVVPFLLVAGVGVVAGGVLVRSLPGAESPQPAAPAAGATDVTSEPVRGATWRSPLLLVGLLGALAFASENAHQSWSAVFAYVELDVGLGTAAVAPAVFAGVVAVARFTLGGMPPARAAHVLVGGAAVAALGALGIAAAPSLPVAALGLALAAAGTGVLFPTLMGVVSRSVPEDRRGRATATVTSVSYLGFLLGPVYVGAWAEGAGLRGAMVAVAALGVLLAALAPWVVRRQRTHTTEHDLSR